jgi:hypothetical protein
VRRPLRESEHVRKGLSPHRTDAELTKDEHVMNEDGGKRSWVSWALNEGIFWLVLGVAGSAGAAKVVPVFWVAIAVGTLIAAVVLLKKQK